jgi:hypothetical protein
MPGADAAGMQFPRQQPTTDQTQPRPKPVVVGSARPAAAVPPRRRAFVLPDVREIPRRAVAGPWESGW